jgi:SAM-dependent methyltransferase
MQLILFLSSVLLVELVRSFTPTYDVGFGNKFHTFLSQQPENVEIDALARRRFLDTSVVSLVGLTAVQSPAHGTTMDKKSGINLPDPGEIESAIPMNWAIIDNPFDDGQSKSLFGRLDAKPDSLFYADPRFVEHVDSNAVKSMTDYVTNEAIGEGDSVLDLCSSWTSHFASTSKKVTKFAGLGMNAKEMEANTALSEFVVQDLNLKPELPYKDGSFDTVICQLSIDYLVSPLQVMKEAARVLKPGGKIHILFSNRLFLSKAVGLWTGADDIDHAFYVGCYLHFSGGNFVDISARDLSTRKGKQIRGDPLYVVTGTRGR